MEEGAAARIGRFLGIDEEAFLARYCETRHGKTYVACGPDGFCVFFEKGTGCLVHPVKPARCALWPFFPEIVRNRHAWEMAKEACPGMGGECTFEELDRKSVV